ncbi:MAG: Uma2 family endonuclease [Gemmataceae bacterium]|nr:Uma2 family endonuclease [Gemmataceae bacterium]
MSTTWPAPPPGLEFPDSDGQPMAENTRQWEAIATLKGNVEAVAPADAFVAGDHLIYPDPTDPADRQAPDVYVAFGRPRGHRGSYKLWEEAGVFPQVIFEVLGPSNTADEMRAKQGWYFGHGAEEYYEFDPEAGTWLGVVVNPATGDPEPVGKMDGFVSPRLGIRFGFRPMELLVYYPTGEPFLTFQQLADARAAERRRADAAQTDNDRLRTLLRAAGIDPDAAAPPG